MTTPRPQDDDIERLLSEFFVREMPADLRAQSASSQVPPVRSDRLSNAAAAVSAKRRRLIRGIMAAAVVFGGLAFVLVNRPASDSRSIATRDRSTVPPASAAGDAESHPLPRPVSNAVADDDVIGVKSVAGVDPPLLEPLVAPRPASLAGHASGSTVPERAGYAAVQVVHQVEPWERRRVPTPAGVVEQRIDVGWANVSVVNETAVTRTDFAVPNEVTITVDRLDDEHAGPSSSFAADSTGKRRRPVVAPRPDVAPVARYLGVFTRTPGPLSNEQPFAPLGGVRGLIVTEVFDRSPAARAGLRPGDLLVACDGVPLDSAGQLRDVIEATSPRTTLRLDIIRDARRESIMTTIGNRTAVRAPAVREWVLPFGSTVYGVDRIPVDRAGRPNFTADRTPVDDSSELASNFVRLLPIDGDRYELQLATRRQHSGKSPGHADETTLSFGTLAELAATLPAASATLPVGVRERLRQAIERPGENAVFDRGVFCRLRPRVHAGRFRLQVVLSWSAADGRRCWIDCDFATGADLPFATRQLPDMPAFAAELAALPAADCDALVAALRGLSLPEPAARVRFAE